MNITGMLIQMPRQISSPNGRLKHERDVETDIDEIQFISISHELRSIHFFLHHTVYIETEK